MRASSLRALLVSLAVVACSSHSGASAGTQPKSTAPPTVVVASAAAPTEPVTSAPAVASGLLDASPGLAAGALDGGAPDPAAPATAAPPKIVLHLGDSMVGGYGGVTKALEAKFRGLGAQFVRDWQTSVSVATFDHEKKLQELLAKHHPDLVILTLGANDVFVPFPSSLAANVRSVAGKASAGGRACYWMTPPVWKKDTGIVDVIKKNAAPCKVFDASNMKIARGGDGIHPTDAGGTTWADGFWAYYQGTGPATPGTPTP